MENESVRYSRAGDVFHYRWAARRCLKMIPPNSPLKCVVIESSKEKKVAGEYVIDVAEYLDPEDNGVEDISYYQLKHTTKRADIPFVLSDLKGTIEGFAARFSSIHSTSSTIPPPKSISFSIITNRPVKFKQEILDIAQGRTPSTRFLNTLEKYTKLTGKRLQEFCSSLKILDGEGNYNTQRHELHFEISQLLSGAVDNALIDSIIALVQDRALPDKNGQIVREDILKRFGVTSERDLFPAPPEFEELEHPIERRQHNSFLKKIITASSPIIIHAAGGVGKTVVARHLSASLPQGSLGIVYDCFGSGKYRNRSQTRHRHRDALVQVINEIAYQGYCDPLIPLQGDLEDSILRAFLNRLQMATTALQKVDIKAKLIIFIDAADNAEMAANNEFNEPCFVHELLREKMPEGCCIVMLCRTELIDMLDPPHGVQQFELAPFTQEETLIHLRKYFPDATPDDGREFWRLTAGNPRVQANALSLNYEKVGDVLVGLGPTVTTVAEQINNQLSSAISRLKENFPKTVQKQIDAICLGLANLSPFIPIKVLATAAEVDTEAVKSFVADLGRPLWLSDDSVQFRDEPTETWFRENFSASEQQIEPYVSRLKPLAQKFPYVAEVLPSLLLQSGKYDELINLALSDDFLPDDSPIDQRNIRVFRLQFAFKAALKQKRYVDAAKLSLRAGEEVAGDNRQMELLKNNIDLIAPLQSQERVQELAFRRFLRGDWDGSENVYSASLLSSVENFKGEARGYLRAAEKWLRLYFEERDRRKKEWRNERLQDEEIVELASVHFNLFGPERLVDFILSWQPREVIFRVARLFIRRLIDAGNFEAVDDISHIGARNQYLMIAIADELLSVGRFPPVEALDQGLDLLCHKRARIPKPSPDWHENLITTAIISFIEACAGRGLSQTKILRVRRNYVSSRASHLVTSDHQDNARQIFLRAVALDSVLVGNLNPDLESLMPKKFLEIEKKYEQRKDVEEFKQVVGGLLPWYIVRACLLTDYKNGFVTAIQEATKKSNSALSHRWRDYDRIPFEISRVRFEILSLSKQIGKSEVKNFLQVILRKDAKIRINDQLQAVRAAYRLEHLSGIRTQLEQSCYEIMESASDEGPETKAAWFIALARAVLPASRADAAVYFDCAIEAVSKFGDEIVERWEAVVSVAKRCAEAENSVPKIAYRFIHCAELVGDNVAREKYFDRNEAVRVCTRLCPASSFAALSRWRDRNIGWFGRQLPALAHEAVRFGIISPATGWSLSAFFEEDDYGEFAALCLEKENDTAKQQYILDTAVRDMRLRDTPKSHWLKLDEVSQRFGLVNNELKTVLSFYSQTKKSNKDSNNLSPLEHKKTSTDIDLERILDSLDLTTSIGINNAIEYFNSIPMAKCSDIFWQEVFKHIPEGNASDFLQALVYAESASRYDVQNALEKFPESWRNKISVKKIWNRVISSVGRRFASELTNYFGLKYFLESIGADDSIRFAIQNGIIDGLADSCDLVGAGTLFGVVGIVSSFISPQEATGLLDFALSRFEKHIDGNYADGLWADWLIPPEEMSDAFTGFVWAALASPRSATRWQAAHCVRRLADMGCQREIDALIEWMTRDCVDAFGSNKFPFYNFHARQYFLIALARVALDHPEIIRCHQDIFIRHALGSFSHILIQKFSAEIALSIENAFPGIYSPDVVKQLRQVGISQFPYKKIDYSEKLKTPWHLNGQVDQNLELHFAYDFDRYWFNYLGDIFGVDVKDIEELARNIVLNDWRVKIDSEFIEDPRSYLYRHTRETWYSHSSYPKTDDYGFYLSYHAMLAIAAKLLHAMPVVQQSDYADDEWNNWLNNHTLTRSDGCWLADRRDPAPLERRAWIGEEKSNNWRWEITPDDIIEGIRITHNGEPWLHIAGYWSDHDGGYEERYRVSAALVSPLTSQSLLNALVYNDDHYNCYLPFPDENHDMLKGTSFDLNRIVCDDYVEKRLDEFDPLAGKIEYPPYQVNKFILEQFQLENDLEQRTWRLPGMKEASIICEIWGEDFENERNEPIRYGKRMGASLDFLKQLCVETGNEIIFLVQIERTISRAYRRDEYESGYQPPYYKIYVFSENGTLRDEKRNYHLR